MSLYVRVQCSFYTHRKTAKLRARLGDDAFWIPPRIWAYAAEHQPDGDFSKFEAGELAMLIGYTKDACSMLEALQQAGFFDGLRVHAWAEYNGYHSVFAERAKKAAEARWGAEKERSKERETRQDKTRKERSQAMLQASNHEVPDEKTAIVTAVNHDIDKSFAEYVWDSFSMRGGKDAAGNAVAWLAYVSKRWKQEQQEWKSKVHHGNKPHKNGSKEKEWM